MSSLAAGSSKTKKRKPNGTSGELAIEGNTHHPKMQHLEQKPCKSDDDEGEEDDEEKIAMNKSEHRKHHKRKSNQSPEQVDSLEDTNDDNDDYNVVGDGGDINEETSNVKDKHPGKAKCIELGDSPTTTNTRDACETNEINSYFNLKAQLYSKPKELAQTLVDLFPQEDSRAEEEWNENVVAVHDLQVFKRWAATFLEWDASVVQDVVKALAAMDGSNSVSCQRVVAFLYVVRPLEVEHTLSTLKGNYESWLTQQKLLEILQSDHAKESALIASSMNCSRFLVLVRRSSARLDLVDTWRLRILAMECPILVSLSLPVLLARASRATGVNHEMPLLEEVMCYQNLDPGNEGQDDEHAVSLERTLDVLEVLSDSLLHDSQTLSNLVCALGRIVDLPSGKQGRVSLYYAVCRALNLCLKLAKIRPILVRSSLETVIFGPQGVASAFKRLHYHYKNEESQIMGEWLEDEEAKEKGEGPYGVFQEGRRKGEVSNGDDEADKPDEDFSDVDQKISETKAGTNTKTIYVEFEDLLYQITNEDAAFARKLTATQLNSWKDDDHKGLIIALALAHQDPGSWRSILPQIKFRLSALRQTKAATAAARCMDAARIFIEAVDAL